MGLEMVFCYIALSTLVMVMASIFLIIHRRTCSTRGHGHVHAHVPLNWPVVGMLPSLLLNLHRILDRSTDILRGSSHSLLFLGPRFSGMVTALTCNPDDLHYFTKTRASKFPKGSDFTDGLDILGDGLINAGGDSWRYQRKIAQKLVHSKEFRLFAEKVTRDKVGCGLMPLLKQVAQQGKVVDLQDVFYRLAFDSMCTLVFGIDTQCLPIEFPIVPFAKATEEADEAMILRFITSKGWWKMLRWLNMGPEKKLAEAWGRIDLFINNLISMRRDELEKLEKGKNGGEAERWDLLTSYLSYHDYDYGNKKGDDQLSKSDNFLRDTTLNLLVAGKDTTSVALSWFFWLLSENPTVMARVLEEQQAVSHKHEANDQFKPQTTGFVVFDSQDLEGLVYLHAALCETLRLYPSVPFSPRGVSEPDVLPSGVEVRPGTLLVFSNYALGRTEDIWGEDALKFRPERWISDKGTLKLDYSKFLVFGVGPRICLGKDLAFIPMKSVAAAILSNFHIQVIQGQNVCAKPSIVLPMKNGLMVKMIERSV